MNFIYTYKQAFIIFAETEKNWWKSKFTPYMFLSLWKTIESKLYGLSQFCPSFGLWYLDKYVAKKMVIRIYYLMDYDKLRPRLRSSWVHFKLCRCICSDAPLRTQVFSISSQIASRRWSKMRSRFCLRMAISSAVGLLFRFFEKVVAFALAKAQHILICSSSISGVPNDQIFPNTSDVP